MLPIRNENPVLRQSLATRGLILANAAMWVCVQGLGTQQGLVRSICKFALIPARLTGALPAGIEIPLGPGASCPIDAGAAWYTLITSMFLHGGWLHILGNLWFLWLFGRNVEDAMGHRRFLLFYLLAGLAAAACQLLVDLDSALPMLGASGAIGGVMGAYVVLYPRVRVHVLVALGFFWTTFAVPAAIILGYWFLLQIVSGLAVRNVPAAGGVAFAAHVGGFLFGIAFVRWFSTDERIARPADPVWR